MKLSCAALPLRQGDGQGADDRGDEQRHDQKEHHHGKRPDAAHRQHGPEPWRPADLREPGCREHKPDGKEGVPQHVLDALVDDLDAVVMLDIVHHVET